MTRDSLRDRAYFDRYVAFNQTAIDEDRAAISEISRDEGRARCASDLLMYAIQTLIQRYSRGDALPDLRDSVMQALALLALKKSTVANAQLTEPVRKMYLRLDLPVLYDGLTLIAFMVGLHMPPADLARAVQLVGPPGEDAILDHVARACGDTSRECATRLKFPAVYDTLLAVIGAPPERRPARLEQFVTTWYRKMAPIPWYDNHEAAEGAYFGYWCFEGALVAMLLGIDDSAVLDHPNYPGDLTRHFRATS